MLARGVDQPDKNRVLQNESLMLLALLIAGTAAVGLVFIAASALALGGGLPADSPLAVTLIGGGAAILLALTLLLWFRGRRDPDPPPSPPASQ